MTRTEACHKFLEAPIVIQFGRDSVSKRDRDWLVEEIGDLPEAKLEFAELEGDCPFGARVFHMGDIISGQRLRDFVAYVRWLVER